VTCSSHSSDFAPQADICQLIDILHLRTYSSETAHTPWYLSARLVNTFGILLPFVILGSTLPFAIRASTSYEKGVVDYFNTNAMLAKAADDWSPDEAIDLSVVGEIAPLLFDALGAFEHSKIWFQRIYYLLAGWCAAFTFAFALVGYLYSRALNKTISDLRSRSSKGVGIEMFRKTRRWLLSLSFCFVVSMGESFDSSIRTAILTRFVMQQRLSAFTAFGSVSTANECLSMGY